MPLYEYYCRTCKTCFEQITSSTDPDQGRCPQCRGLETERQISKFAVAGQGDQRETTAHGCHGYSGGHTHGKGCGH